MTGGNKGLTLAEVIVGLVIFGLLLGLGVLNSRSAGKGAISQAVAESLAENLRQAREEAMADGTCTAVVIPSGGGTRPHSASFYRLKGRVAPGLASITRLDHEFPGALLFVGHWPLNASALHDSTALNTTVHPPTASNDNFSFGAWQAPYPQDHHFIFTPSGTVQSNSRVLFDGAYHIVVCQGVDYGGGAVEGTSSAVPTRIARPYTVVLSLAGAVRVEPGLRASSTSLGVDEPFRSGVSAAPAPSLPGSANQAPVITALEVFPEPYTSTLPPGVDATVDLSGYLTLRARAQDPDGGPLHCNWIVDGGSVSSGIRTRMEWNGTDWASVWEWRPPETAEVGDRFQLTCSVEDAQGSLVNELLGAAGVVEVIGVGDLVFETNRDGNREIYAMNADGSNLINLTNSPADDMQPMWSPDGTRIAFVSNRAGLQEIYVMNEDGSDVRKVSASTALSVNLPHWSPDGTQLVYAEVGGGAPFVWRVNADGSNPQQLFDNPGDGWVEKSWHAGGLWLACARSAGVVGSAEDVFLMELAGTVVANLTALTGNDERPAWSPDGTALAWTSDRNGNFEVYVADFDGSALMTPVNVSNDPATQDDGPEWSPDGQQVVFHKLAGGNGDIYRVNRDGSNPVRLTTDPADDRWPSWRP